MARHCLRNAAQTAQAWRGGRGEGVGQAGHTNQKQQWKLRELCKTVLLVKRWSTAAAVAATTTSTTLGFYWPCSCGSCCRCGRAASSTHLPSPLCPSLKLSSGQLVHGSHPQLFICSAHKCHAVCPRDTRQPCDPTRNNPSTSRTPDSTSALIIHLAPSHAVCVPITIKR